MMRRLPSAWLELAAAGLTLLFLAGYTYAQAFVVPYIGFEVQRSSGAIRVVYAEPESGARLQPGDRLLQVDGVPFAELVQKAQQDNQIHPFLHYRAGDEMLLQVQRGDQELKIPWVVPRLSWIEFLNRISLRWLPLVYWLTGTVTLLSIKRRSGLRSLFVAFTYLTALWLTAEMMTGGNIWHSLEMSRALIWLCIPVYWHLHWNFFRPLKRLPRALVVGIYLLGGLLAAGELLHLTFKTFYKTGLLVTLIGSVILLAAHLVQKPFNRQQRGLLGLALTIVLVPLLGLLVVTRFFREGSLMAVTLFVQPTIPISYYILLFGSKMGSLEARANRSMTLLIFGDVVFTLAVVLLSFQPRGTQPDSIYSTFPYLVLAVLMVFLTALIYPVFNRWVGQRLLGMSLLPTRLERTFLSRISTSLDLDRLVSVLRDDIIPTLLIRQAVFLRMDSAGKPATVMSLGVEPDEIPSQAELPGLLAQSGEIRPEGSEGDSSEPDGWIRLVLPVTFEGATTGVFLLGQREIDEDYSPAEVQAMRTLTDAAGLALVNINQAEQLHALYQEDIAREEAERSHLARELHDDVLSQLALMTINTDEREGSPAFQAAYQTAVAHIREIISGLRPSMLSYGIYPGLQQLADDFSAQYEPKIQVDLEIEPCEQRYPAEVELHLYQVIRQACQNARQHSRAKAIVISGKLEEGRVELAVEDHGVGFESGEPFDLGWMLANRHFGLVGMYERAALIGAKLRIVSSPEEGTRVEVRWEGG